MDINCSMGVQIVLRLLCTCISHFGVKRTTKKRWLLIVLAQALGSGNIRA